MDSRIPGRLGIKSIESGSTLLSAADIEKTILSSPDIIDCYVVGLGDTDVSRGMGTRWLNSGRLVDSSKDLVSFTV